MSKIGVRKGPTWLFFRYMGEPFELRFYPVCCNIPNNMTDHEALMANIEANKNTIKVEDPEGNILWERKLH